MFEPTYDAYAPRRRDGGRRASARCALAPPDWRFDAGSAGGGVRAAHARADPEHAPQPDGQGVHARRAGGDRGAVPAPRRAGDQRRGLLARSCSTAPRTSRSRRCPTCSSARSRSTAWARRSASPAGRSAGRSRPPPLTAAVRAVHQFVTFTNSAPFQEALADVLPVGRRRTATTTSCAPTTRAGATCSRRVLRGAGLRRCRSAAPTSCSPTSASSGYASDVDFCRRLVTEIGVAAIPTSVFYADAPKRRPPSRASASRNATRRSSPRRRGSRGCAPSAQASKGV